MGNKKDFHGNGIVGDSIESAWFPAIDDLLITIPDVFIYKFDFINPIGPDAHPVSGICRQNDPVNIIRISTKQYLASKEPPKLKVLRSP
jgi:hypothetical protein